MYTSKQKAWSPEYFSGYSEITVEECAMWNMLRSQFTLSNLANEIVWSLIVTGLFKVAIWAWGKKPVRRTAFWAAVFVLIFVSLMLVNLGGAGSITTSLDGIVIGNPNPKDQYIPDQTPLLIVVSARNTGRPSILEAWTLTIRWQDGSTSALEASRFPQTMDVNGADKTKRHYTRANDSLVDKTLTPIPAGAMVRGLAIWVLPKGRTVNDLLTAPQGTVSATDINGVEYKLNVPWQHLSNHATGEVLSYPALGELEKADK